MQAVWFRVWNVLFSEDGNRVHAHWNKVKVRKISKWQIVQSETAQSKK